MEEESFFKPIAHIHNAFSDSQTERYGGGGNFQY